MIRVINVILAISCIGALAGVYALKFGVEQTAEERSALVSNIARQEGELSMLEADWAYLNHPGHIEPIVRRHQASLGVENARADQWGDFNSLPMRPADPDSTGMDALFEALALGVDPADLQTVEN